MRKALLLGLAVLAFAFLALPAMAVIDDPVSAVVDFDVFIAPIGEWSITTEINDVTINTCDDFLPFYNIGDICYSVCSNVPWALTGYWDKDDENPDENELDFPADWVIYYSYPTLPSEFFVFPEDEVGTALLDSGECDNFDCRYINFGLTGPDICDPAGEYGVSMWFFLGAV